MTRKLLLLTTVLVLTLTGCASGPTIIVNAMPGADISSFQTYNFMQPLGTDRSNGARTPMSTWLINSVSRELNSRGMRQSDSPGLLVDFFVTTEERMDVRTTSSSMHSVHRSHWNRGFSTWPSYQTRVRQYTEGSLLIDLIDPSTSTLVAETAASRRISDSSFSQEQADDLVAQLMARVWAN